MIINEEGMKISMRRAEYGQMDNLIIVNVVRLKQ